MPAAAGLTAGLIAILPGVAQAAVHTTHTASLTSASSFVPPLGGSTPATAKAKQAKVAPLTQTVQPGLLVVGSAALPKGLLAKIRKLPGMVAAEQVEAFRMNVNGKQTAVIGADPSAFRAFAAHPTGADQAFWQGVAAGGIGISYQMGSNDKLKVGGMVTAAGRTSYQLKVSAFGTLGIGGVDAVVSDATAKALGAPAGNAIVVSVKAANFTADSAALKKLLPHGASVEPLVSLTHPSSAGAGSSSGISLPSGTIGTMLKAALSRQGLPYVWGATGPNSFDCSGLVQWAFAQAGVTMPRVAADQALAGPAVPVSQLQPGDLLFYHFDPTAPNYISHVAIYLGNGEMLEAPETGRNVSIVPAFLGTGFAGAIRVTLAQAASSAGRL